MRMLRLLALLGLVGGGLFARASPEADDDEALVEDEEARPAGIPGFPDGKLPSAEELLKMLDSMSGLSDEDREAIRADLTRKAAGGGGGGAEPAPQAVPAGSAFPEFLVLLGMLAFITLIFVFFGYKLYKSLSERERKREEKKKNKQMKKKK